MMFEHAGNLDEPEKHSRRDTNLFGTPLMIHELSETRVDKNRA